MGLQVWLPLNGNYKNQGLIGDLTVLTTPSFVSGKIGQAMCGGAFRLSAEQTNKILNNNYFSICFWVYINQDTNTSKINRFFGNSNMSAPNNRRFTIYHYDTCNKLHISWQNYDSNSEMVGYVSGNDLMPSYQWTHIAVTYSNPKREIKIYKNGSLYHTISNAYQFTNPNYSYDTNVIDNDTGKYICDYRIYDECLSENDIKRLVNNKTFDLVNQCNVAFDRAGQIAGGVIPYNITTSGSAFYFNGTDAAIQIPFTDMQAGEFTMNTWFYKDSFGSQGWETIFGGPSGFELQTKRNRTASPVIVLYSWGGSSNSALDIPYNLNQWNMLTMTRNANDSKFYLNGELKQTGSTGYIPSGNYFIGAWRDSNSQNYKGYVKEFSIYAKALEASEISQLYEIGPQVDVLPEGYTRLEYIESTGSQWINTNWHPTTNFKVNTKIYVSNINSSSEYGLFGNYTDGKGVAFGYYNKKIYWGANTSNGWQNLTQLPITSNTVTIQYNASQTLSSLITSEGSTSSTTILYTFNDITNPCFIFKPHYPDNWLPFIGKVYYLNIIENNSMVRNFIPAKRKSDNVLGMYDIVNNVFYTNDGTGTFTAGPEI